MFEKPVLFVVGAGASSDFGFPLGSALGEQIADALSIEPRDGQMQFRDQSIQSAIEVYNGEFKALRRNPLMSLEAGKAVADAMMVSPSIDTFLETHTEQEHVIAAGKLAISHIIFSKERKLHYHRYRQPDEMVIEPQLARETWFGPFFEVLVDGVTVDNLEEIFKNITFVVFNYGRCVEQLLVFALKKRFLISLEEAAHLVNGLKIFHPYGQVGWLPWQYRDDEITSESLDYGEDCSGWKLLDVARQI